MRGLRNSESTAGVEVLTQAEYDALTGPGLVGPRQGILYVVGTINEEEYTQETLTPSSYTAEVYVASQFDAGAADLAAAIASYVPSSITASSYTREVLVPSTHTHATVTVSAVYNGVKQQDVLIDNNDKLVWMTPALITGTGDTASFTNADVPIDDLI